MENTKETERYFNLTTQNVGTIQTLSHEGEEDERWFHSSDGIESHIIGVGEILLPYDAFLAVLGAIAKSIPQKAIGQHIDNFPINIGQDTDNGETAPSQPSDSGRTEEQRKADTQAARDSKRPAPTSAEIVKAYAGVVKMLKNDRFIREVSKGVYGSFKDLPKNCPDYIVAEINKAGHRRKDGRLFTQDTVSPIVSAMKIESKPSVFKLVYLVCLAVLISVVVTKVVSSGTSPQKATEINQTEQKTEQIKTNFVFDKNKINQICSRNKIQLTDTRINTLLAMTFSDEAELEKEVLNQYRFMLEVMSKNKK